jgi:hypothetical protein
MNIEQVLEEGAHVVEHTVTGQRLIERGIERGIEKGAADATRAAIRSVLEARFGVLPPALGAHLQELGAREALEQLVPVAALAPSLEAFAQRLSEDRE